jgi:hypothetical protein
MNGDTAKIEIFKPFGEAWVLTKKILFQPFDLGKWCVIGFAAFLASLSGGMHFNFNGFDRNRDWHWKYTSVRHGIMETTANWPAWLIVLVIAAIPVAIAVVALCMWLGARGRFMFIDCIVRNRAAIKEPWREFRAEGNSFFLFSLLVALLLLAVAAIMAVPIFLPLILHSPNLLSERAMVIWLICFGTVILLVALAWHWIAQLMVPVMYRRRCRAMAALRDVLGLIINCPAPLILYFLFFIVLAIAVIIVACAAMCLTCCIACIAAIPYVGTVILLPLHVILYAFPLLFLRQFGNDYDAWAGRSPFETMPPPLPPSSPLPSVQP